MNDNAKHFVAGGISGMATVISGYPLGNEFDVYPNKITGTGRMLFYPNLAVEELPNCKLLLGHSHFDYVEPLLNHTSSTAKLG